MSFFRFKTQQDIKEQPIENTEPQPQEETGTEYSCTPMERTLRLVPAVTAPNLDIGMSSVIGTREYQQDAADICANTTGCVMAVLCDGMGGMEEGGQASTMCVHGFCQDFSLYSEENYPDFLCREIHKLDIKVANMTNQKGVHVQTGTTLVSVIISSGQLYWASAGDSRIYLIRGREMVRVTQDHNYSLILKEKVAEQTISLYEAEHSAQKEALISYIGMGNVSRVNVNETPFPLEDGDRILLCSDGLYKAMEEEMIHRTLELYTEDMSEAAEVLTATASCLSKSGQDNTTVIIIKYIE